MRAFLEAGADDVGEELAGTEADLRRLVEEERRGHHAAGRIGVVEKDVACGGVEAVDAGVNGKAQLGEEPLGLGADALDGLGGQVDGGDLAAATRQVLAAVVEQLALVLDDLGGGQGDDTAAVGFAQDDGRELLAGNEALDDDALLGLVSLEGDQGVPLVLAGGFEVVVDLVGGVEGEAMVATLGVEREG